ncbi:MAG: metalloregulator ArsR/SmtB family transcription factor [Gemmatimonadaceae bacterium]
MSRKNLSGGVRRRNFAPVFRALGDETRLSIVAKLSNGEPHSIARLTAGTRLSRQAVTKHLRVLEDAHLVHSVRAGRENLFELDPTPIREVREYADVVSEHWDRALARLKALVED